MAIVAKEVVRIAGEAKLVLVCNKGIVEEARFITTAPVRGFERLLEGKNPLFAVEAAMRICGACHSAHGIAACEAIEHALGVLPPRDGLLIREAIGLLNRVQSHLIQVALVARDVFRRFSDLNITFKVLEALECINSALARVGGAPTHPPALIIGGIAREIKESALKDALAKIEKASQMVTQLRELFFNEKEWTDAFRNLEGVHLNHNRLASHLYYGDRFNIDIEAVEVIKRRSEGELGEFLRKSTSLVARYRGAVVEVGPRARLEIYRFGSYRGVAGVQLARLDEMLLSLKRIEEVLQQVDLNAPLRTRELIYRRGSGVGVYEAPRGTLIHRVRLDDEGRVDEYKIIVPTMFNIEVIEEYCKGLTVEEALLTARIFDPCVPCATHVVEKR